MFFFSGNKGKVAPEDDLELKEKQTVSDPEKVKGDDSAEETEDIIPVPPVSEPFFGLKNKIAYFGFSQQGKSHIESNTPCQDRCGGEYVQESNYLILAVADGVGSCALSDLGADTAVHAVVDFIRKEILKSDSKKLDSTLAGSMLRNAMQFAYDQVESAAMVNEQLLYSLQSTLTVAVYDGTDLYFAHAGDDGIVALTKEGTLALATTRHKGEEASSVYPLQGKSMWQFGMVPNTVAFVMATDGVLDAFVRNSFEKDRVYYPFVEPIFTGKYESEQDVEQMCKDLYSYMNGEKYRSTVTDDLTITVAMNLDKLSTCLPEFDADAWNEETRMYDEKRRNALYNKSTEHVQHHTGKGEQSVDVNQQRETDTPPRPGRPHVPYHVEEITGSGHGRGTSRENTSEKLQEDRNDQNANKYEPNLNRNAGSNSQYSHGRRQESYPPRYPAPRSPRKKPNNRWGLLGVAIAVLVGFFLFLALVLAIPVFLFFAKLLVNFLRMFL